jgi:hypothetical protein
MSDIEIGLPHIERRLDRIEDTLQALLQQSNAIYERVAL